VISIGWGEKHWHGAAPTTAMTHIAFRNISTARAPTGWKRLVTNNTRLEPSQNKQVALAWLLSKPVITAPIVGATKPHHLDDAVAALAVQLTPDEIHHLEEAYQPHPVIGFA